MGRPKKKSTSHSGKKVQALPGMIDHLPGFNNHWEHTINRLERLAKSFGFSRAEIPMLENIELYEDTDIGDKTLITCVDPEGNRIAVRPATLPGLMRAFGERKIVEGEKLWKWYHLSPTILYDEKRKKFVPSWEYGFELFGEFLPLTEVQLISLTYKFLKSIGLSNITIEINSIGKTETRKDYEENLRSFLQTKKYELCNECVSAIEEDPLQVFRCKNLECQTVAAEAPQVVDYLDTEAHKYFTHILEGLDELGVSYMLNPMLVGRVGSSRTVFCIKYKDENNEHFIGEGGYHEDILKDLTGKAMPCFGFTGNIETLEKILQGLNIEHSREIKPEVFLVPLGDLAAKKALRLFSELWDEQIAVHDDFGESGVKNQLKMAENSKAAIALIIGQKEAMDEMVILRDVKSGMQEIFQYERIIEEVKKRLGK